MVTKRSPGEIIFDIGNAVFLGILTLIFLYPMWYVIMAAFSDPARFVSHTGLLWLPEGFTADKTEFDIFAPHWTPFTLDCISEIKEIKVKAGESIRAINEIMVEIRVLDGFAREFIPLMFISK